jgi:hypothetical protein
MSGHKEAGTPSRLFLGSHCHWLQSSPHERRLLMRGASNPPRASAARVKQPPPELRSVTSLTLLSCRHKPAIHCPSTSRCIRDVVAYAPLERICRGCDHGRGGSTTSGSSAEEEQGQMLQGRFAGTARVDGRMCSRK